MNKLPDILIFIPGAHIVVVIFLGEREKAFHENYLGWNESHELMCIAGLNVFGAAVGL